MSAAAAAPPPGRIVRIGWFKRLFPLLLLEAYLTVTVLLFAFGPYDYPIRHPNELYGFLIGVQVALAVGYLLVAHARPKVVSASPTRMVIGGLVVLGALFPLVSYGRTGNWIPDVVGGFNDPGNAYRMAHEFADRGGNAGTYLRILLAPALAMAFPLGVFYWSALGRASRIALVLLWVGTLLISVATGQRRDFADLLIFAPLLGFATNWAGATRYRPQTLLAIALAAVAGLVLLAVYFVYSHSKRVGEEAAQAAVHVRLRTPPDPENFVLQALPPSLRPGAVGLMFYTSGGYYGLSLAMGREFKPMYGAGHSMFLTRNVSKVLKDPTFERRSYPVQISDRDGITYPVYWSTAYPFFASDVTFAGVVLLAGIFGSLFGLSWVDVLGGRNPFAVVFFAHMAILLFYLPATNRMLQDGDSLLTFYFWLGAWLLYRHPPMRRSLA